MDKTYVFDFSVDAWVQQVRIEAENEDEAKEKLFQMSLDDIVENGYVHDFDINDLDYEVEDDEEDYEDDDDYDFDFDDEEDFEEEEE